MICGTAENRASRNGGQWWWSAKTVRKSGLLTYVRDFLAVFPARHAQAAEIILKLRSNYDIMRLKVCGSDSVKCIWEKPVRG